jgi:hypothetical protein
MKTRHILQQLLVIGCLLAAQQAFALQTETAVQNRDEGAKSNTAMPMFVTAKPVASLNKALLPKGEKPLASAADKIPLVNLKKVEADKITSFFVRANDSKRIQLSMLVAYKTDLAEAVRQLLGEKVTPLVFSVSTLPNRAVVFDPAKLRFEQRGRAWQPATDNQVADIVPLDDNAKFGGVVQDGEVHQGIVLLPAWIDPQQPITLRYGDFHYLARFAEAPAPGKNGK